jgi:hypothetical protein
MTVIINSQPFFLSLIFEAMRNNAKEIIKHIYNTKVDVTEGSKVVKIPAKLAEVIYDFNERSSATNN